MHFELAGKKARLLAIAVTVFVIIFVAVNRSLYLDLVCVTVYYEAVAVQLLALNRHLFSYYRLNDNSHRSIGFI